MTSYRSIKYLREIIEWDFINWSVALTYWENNASSECSNAAVLEIGAYNGGLALWLAQKGSKVICSDLNGPTEAARQKHTKYKVQYSIQYAAINALDIPYNSFFDIIIFKSVLGGIGRNNKKDLQIQTISQIYKALKPGGELLFAENLVASPIHRFFRRHFVKWGTEWRYVSVQEIKEFLSIFSDFKFTTVGFLGAFGRTDWQRNILGVLDRIIFNYITPRSWKYIIIGIAKK